LRQEERAMHCWMKDPTSPFFDLAGALGLSCGCGTAWRTGVSGCGT